MGTLSQDDVEIRRLVLTEFNRPCHKEMHDITNSCFSSFLETARRETQTNTPHILAHVIGNYVTMEMLNRKNKRLVDKAKQFICTCDNCNHVLTNCLDLTKDEPV